MPDENQNLLADNEWVRIRVIRNGNQDGAPAESLSPRTGTTIFIKRLFPLASTLVLEANSIGLAIYIDRIPPAISTVSIPTNNKNNQNLT